MMRRLRKLGCDSAGTAVIELALIAPVLALMIVGIADVSIAYGRRLELEQAVQRSIEKVMQTTGDTTVAGTIKKETVCQINGTNDDNSCATGRLTAEEVTVTYRLECTDGAGTATVQTSTDADAFDALECANASDTPVGYVQVTAVDTYTPMFKIHFGTGDNDVYDLSATAGVRVK